LRFTGKAKSRDEKTGIENAGVKNQGLYAQEYENKG